MRGASNKKKNWNLLKRKKVSLLNSRNPEWEENCIGACLLCPVEKVINLSKERLKINGGQTARSSCNAQFPSLYPPFHIIDELLPKLPSLS